MPRPSPSPLPLRGPPLPHSHLLLSNEKVTAENPNTPAAESPLWHLAARGGGLLGSTWWILRHSTFGAAWHLRHWRHWRGQSRSRQWPPAGSWRAKATGQKDKKEAESGVGTLSKSSRVTERIFPRVQPERPQRPGTQRPGPGQVP